MTKSDTLRHHPRPERSGVLPDIFRAAHDVESNVIALAERRKRRHSHEPKLELATVLRRMIEAAALIREAEPARARELVLDAAEDLLAYARRL